MDYVEGLGRTRQELDAYAKEVFSKWVQEDPYRRQVGAKRLFKKKGAVLCTVCMGVGGLGS